MTRITKTVRGQEWKEADWKKKTNEMTIITIVSRRRKTYKPSKNYY